MTAQDKILHVANKLGLTSLKDMQGSTGAVYDVDTDNAGVIFGNSARHQNPSVTNVNDNRFEVNEALLIESIGFFHRNNDNGGVSNLVGIYGSNTVILFDLVIGNKTVMKDTPVFISGMPYTFANVTQISVDPGTGTKQSYFYPRHQIFMEGAGILIPPQVEFYVNYRVYNLVTGAVEATLNNVGAYLFGTRVLLNFNTSI